MTQEVIDNRELPSTVHQHYLDDPYCDVSEDCGESAKHWWIIVLIAAVLIPGGWLLSQRLLHLLPKRCWYQHIGDKTYQVCEIGDYKETPQ